MSIVIPSGTSLSFFPLTERPWRWTVCIPTRSVRLLIETWLTPEPVTTQVFGSPFTLSPAFSPRLANQSRVTSRA